jgi:predicted RNA-binding Zn ribbon-like protein
MNEQARQLKALDRVGGHPALDFVNTVNSWAGGVPGTEYLRTYTDILDWHQAAGMIGAGSRRALSRNPLKRQEAAVKKVTALRGALRALFHAVAARKPLPQRSLDRLNEVIRETARWRRLVAHGGEISCGWDFEGAPPEAVLGPVAWQAAELLEHGGLDRVKECPTDEGCGWLFLDLSKNRSRTWCSMKTCGNSAKVKRFRARQ